jgi:hypothetical protein
MLARNAIRTARVSRIHRAPLRCIRNQSTVNQSSSGTSPALIGGIAGGAAAVAGFYGWYHFSGAKTIVQTANSTKGAYQNMVKSLQEKAPEPNEALDVLKKTALSYAAFIPGARGYIESAFNDLETVRKNRSGEVDKIVKEGYGELHDLTKKGDASLETAQKAWQILQKHIEKLGSLASDSAGDIIGNHPELKEKFGGNIDQIKQLGDRYGSEGKKIANQTWDQVRDAVKDGIDTGSLAKVKDIIQQNVDKLKKFGDDAWNKGLEEIKPQLEKNPKLKEAIEKNSDRLKQGDVSQLWNIVKSSANSGSTKEAEDYIKNATQKAKDSAPAGLDQLLGSIPSGGAISSKLSQLYDIAKEHGEEAEKLTKDTLNEIQEVLQKRLSQAEKIADKAKDESKQ